MKPVFSTKFVILENSNGLFIEPTYYNREKVFSSFGYDSKEEAIAEIVKLEYHHSNIFIFEKVFISWE